MAATHLAPPRRAESDLVHALFDGAFLEGEYVRADLPKFDPSEPRDEAGRWTSAGGDVNARIWDQGSAGSSGRGISMTEKDVVALRSYLKANPAPPTPMTDAGRAKLAEVERGLLAHTGMGKTREHGAWVSADGRVLGEYVGDKNGIHNIEQDPQGKFADAVFTHSHPTIRGVLGGGLSPNDVMTAMVYRASEIRAVDAANSYAMRAPAGGWNVSTWVDNRDWIGRVEWLAQIRGDREEILNWWPTFAAAIGATYTVTPHD